MGGSRSDGRDAGGEYVQDYSEASHAATGVYSLWYWLIVGSCLPVDLVGNMTFTPPQSLGRFVFPPPYGTEGIRLTNASNAPQGCEPRLYSYWNVIGNHRGRPDLYVFVQRRGLNPLVLRVEKATGKVSLQRELAWAGLTSGEGSYFSDTDPTKLYWLAGNTLHTTNVETGQAETVFSLDPQYGDDLWQAHSSADDRTHSATVRWRTSDGPYRALGAVVYKDGQQRFFPKQGDYDECQIDKSGRWLVIQENRDDRIVDLRSGATRLVRDADGAVAHCDVGDGIAVGEDDRTSDNWRMRLWDLDNGSTRVLFEGVPPWGDGLGHVAIRAGRVLLSSNRSTELLDVSMRDGTYRVVAPGMLAVAPGMNEDEKYDRQLRACWDPSGEWACFISNMGDPYGRFDAFLVRVSAHAFNPPIIVPPDPKPKPGGPLVAGSQPYPSEADGGWWSEFESQVAETYKEADKPFPDSAAAFRWHGRTAYDIGAGMNAEQAKTKHLRELRQALGLGGQPGNP